MDGNSAGMGITWDHFTKKRCRADDERCLTEELRPLSVGTRQPLDVSEEQELVLREAGRVVLRMPLSEGSREL